MHEGCQHEFNEWKRIIRACYVDTDKQYSKHGGRGIGIYEPWRKAFDNFLKDMGFAPPGAVLRRKDTNRAFNPDNAYWGPVNGGDS